MLKILILIFQVSSGKIDSELRVTESLEFLMQKPDAKFDIAAFEVGLSSWLDHQLGVMNNSSLKMRLLISSKPCYILTSKGSFTRPKLAANFFLFISDAASCVIFFVNWEVF